MPFYPKVFSIYFVLQRGFSRNALNESPVPDQAILCLCPFINGIFYIKKISVTLTQMVHFSAAPWHWWVGWQGEKAERS